MDNSCELEIGESVLLYSLIRRQTLGNYESNFSSSSTCGSIGRSCINRNDYYFDKILESKNNFWL